MILLQSMFWLAEAMVVFGCYSMDLRKRKRIKLYPCSNPTMTSTTLLAFTVNSHWTDLILMSLNSSQERRIDDRSTAELLGQIVKAAFIISQLPPGSERSGFGIKSPGPFGLCVFF